ncbi:mannose-1-phosphate guanyltransferase [Mucor velutinosus]|uniref:Mannose-1-phosphate guanyltransferase n=1 Tax=Mucor velutinosus TaxID=708070 RepID=A0AAN7DE26_9FUNG|nr:mannose-1-phosphate guanyltransferase [Mucor velutinosus]
MNYYDNYPLYYYSQDNASLEEQLNLFNQQATKELSVEQLLSTPIPTMYIPQPSYQAQPQQYQPSSPSSSLSSSPSDKDSQSPILHDQFLDELFIPEMELHQLPTLATAVSSCNHNNKVVKAKKKPLSYKKSYPPGQCTLPIRVATHKPVRPPRHLECFNCKITKTPLWRRTPDRLQTLCNACGLYYKQYNQHRPIHIRHKPTGVNTTTSTPALLRPPSYQQEKWIAPIEFEQQHQHQQSPSPSSSPRSEQHDDIECINCQQTNTPLWRKNENGDPLCNACGLYAKLNHRNRPVEMRKSTIQRRRRDWASSCDAASQQQSSLTKSDSMAPFLTTFPSAEVSDMNKAEIQDYLGLLEHKCDLLRHVLDK